MIFTDTQFDYAQIGFNNYTICVILHAKITYAEKETV